MGKVSQRKGRAGELELAAILKEHGYNVHPGRPQSYGEEPDLRGLPGIHIEVKRAEQLRLEQWMEQAIRDSEKFGGLPAVFHRRNRQPWLVTMRLGDWMMVYERRKL